MDAEARKIERVDIELERTAENVTAEMRHEHQADIDPDEGQRRVIARRFARRTQDKLDEHERAEKPTQPFEARYARTGRDQQVKILRAQAGDAGRRVQAQDAKQARNYRR